jgi:hypothetical protein
MRAIVLHFKFLTGFYDGVVASIAENAGVAEKGLEERSSYVDALARQPELSLRNDRSVIYNNSLQLAELGWAITSEAFQNYAKSITPQKPISPRKRIVPHKRIAPKKRAFSQKRTAGGKLR